MGLTDHEGHGGLGVLLDDGGDGVDVGLVLVQAVVGDGVLAVAGKGGAVSVREIVDDECAHDRRGSAGRVLGLDVGEVGVHSRDLGGGVAACGQFKVKCTRCDLTYNHVNVPTLATALALACKLEGKDGMASVWISDE